MIIESIPHPNYRVVQGSEVAGVIEAGLNVDHTLVTGTIKPDIAARQHCRLQLRTKSIPQ